MSESGRFIPLASRKRPKKAARGRLQVPVILAGLVLCCFSISKGQVAEKPATEIVEILLPEPPDECASGCWPDDPPNPGPDPGPIPPVVPPPPPNTPCSPPCLFVPIVIEVEPDCPDQNFHLCPPGSARARATLIGCDDEVIESQEFASDESVGCESGTSHECPPGATGVGTTCVTFNFVFDVCENVPKQVKIETFGTGPHDNGVTCDVIEVPGPTAILDVDPPEVNCQTPPETLSCLACSPTVESSKGRAALFKGPRSGESGHRHVVYSAPMDSDISAGTGEIINGVYRVPGKGLLIVEVNGADGAAEVFGSASAHGQGWQVNPTIGDFGRRGSRLVATQCIEWDEKEAQAPDPRFEFNIRTLRGVSGTLDIVFRWHEWDEDDCCVRRQVERLKIDVQPLPCLLEAREPVTAQLRRLNQPSNPAWEARVPCCPTCGDGGRACPAGNLSDWFVLWPQQGTGLVLDGHAKSWRLEAAGLMLTAPTTSGLVNVFEESP